MNCPFCNSILDNYECLNHKFIVRYYNFSNEICFDICDQYAMFINKHYISVFDFYIFKYVISIDNTFQITPDNAESVLFKLLSLKAFS
jgi:hypothetical protein